MTRVWSLFTYLCTIFFRPPLIHSAHFDDSTEVLDEHPKHYSVLAIKQGIEGYTNSIDVGSSSYLDLVTKSKIFLDNTLLIEEVLKNYTRATTLLVCPNKWGKTMNLDMLRTFFQIQVDEDGKKIPIENTTTYKLFREGEIVRNGSVEKLETPLLISSRTTLLHRYQGRFPVVYFSLKDAIGADLASIKDRVRNALSRTFQQHRYLIRELNQTRHNSEHLVLFQDILDGNVKDEDIPDALILLCHTLEAYFNKKSILLIDDYDSYIHFLMQNDNHTSQELKQILKFMSDIVEVAFRQNMHMEFGIATGILQINIYHWPLHNHTVYINDRSAPISAYFGFPRTVVEELLKKHDLPEDLCRKAHQWYKGYASEEPSKFFYNPWSISNFLKSKYLTCYRIEGYRETFMQNVLNGNHTIRNTIFQILSKLIMSAEKNWPFMRCDLEGLRLRGENLLTYLSDKGYLSRISCNPLFNRTINNKLIKCSVSMPNTEIAYQIGNWILTYTKNQFEIADHFLHIAAIRLVDLIENRTESSNMLAHALQNLYKSVSSRINDQLHSSEEYHLPTQEHPVHLIFDCVCLQVQFETQFEYQAYYKKLLKADVVFFNEEQRHAAILQLKYNHESPARALAHAEIYQYIVDEYANHMDTLNIIGISVSANYTVCVDNTYVVRKKLTVV